VAKLAGYLSRQPSFSLGVIMSEEIFVPKENHN
jgi:hypothetical protein